MFELGLLMPLTTSDGSPLPHREEVDDSFDLAYQLLDMVFGR
jgi:hypothetical protein